MEPRTSSRNYLHSLDGWRAIAITFVLFDHSQPLHGRVLHALQGRGNAAVWLFFAISGLLICSRLLQEEASTGAISLSRFYGRRAFRILPPAVAYLAVVAVLAYVGIIPLDKSSWVASLFFYRNYWGVLHAPTAASWFTGHYWSLSVEEHFYLLLPAILVFLPYARRQVLLWLSLFLVVLNVASFAVPSLYPWVTSDERTEFCLIGLLVPALYATLMASPDIRQRARRWLRPVYVVPIGFVVLGLHPLHLHNTYLNFFQVVTIRSVVNPLILLSTILAPESLLTRALEFAPLRFVGRISYSLYLWQSLFLTQNLVYGGPIHRLQTPVLAVPCIFVCAIASYYLLEMPMIRLGQRLMSSGRAQPSLRGVNPLSPSAQLPANSKSEVRTEAEEMAQRGV